MPIGSIIQQPTPVDINRELQRMYRRNANIGAYRRDAGNGNGLQSALYDPLSMVDNRYGNLRTADRSQYRGISCKTLRRVASKAWIINLCKLNLTRHIEPYLKPATNNNLRGFIILKKGEDISKVQGKSSKEADAIEKFLIMTGREKDDSREDTFIKFCTKILNDMFDLDQMATEIRYSRNGKPYDFWAIDSATIEKVLPGQENPENIKYVQVVDHIPYAFYTQNEMVFDFQNARTELDYSFYGQSYVEKCIDLITAFINTFQYNAGYFTENKLPRGMLLIDGDASQETVEQMEDYIYDIMSGSPTSQWRIPIIPSGRQKSEGQNQIKWVSLNGTNKEMEFQQWNDYLTSAVCSIFGTSIDDIGLQTSKAQPLFNGDAKHKYTENKSRVLGNVLGYLQSYLNQIIEKFFPDYQLEFVGYEREDPKEVLDLDKVEMETFKTLNEKREEKGLKPLKMDWADIPMNQSAVQLYQGEQQGGMAGMTDPGEMDGMAGGDGGNAGGGNEAGDFGGGADQQTPEVQGGDFGDGGNQRAPEGDLEKSLQGGKPIRIVV
ncbi:hypothetical protein AGMMS50268_17050 [Spirochaetia bacterium]|nr:hypothetical protein AGMMS50268_17050 [Spirochaetia bacterium]